MVNSPDLNDPEIRALLDRNHVPEELTLFNADTGKSVTTKVACERCRETYPCSTRRALRDHSRQQRETALREMWNSYPKRPCSRSDPHGEHSYMEWLQTYHCVGVEQPHQDCGRREPHGEHVWVPVKHGWPHICPGTDYQYVDCDDVISRSHKAHAWNFRGADFWCSGG